MPDFSATAVISKGTASVTLNGDVFELAIDAPITATVTGSTVAEAKQNARSAVNLAAFRELHTKIAAVTVKDISYLKKGRVSSDYSIWLNTNIVKVVPLLK